MYSSSINLQASQVSITNPITAITLIPENHSLFNLLLQHRRVQRTTILRRRNNLRHQQRMGNLLATLHDPHNRRLRLELAVLLDAFVRLFVLFLGLFQLDLVDLDAHLGVGEGSVVAEFVGRRHFAAFRVFGQHAVATAS